MPATRMAIVAAKTRMPPTIIRKFAHHASRLPTPSV